MQSQGLFPVGGAVGITASGWSRKPGSGRRSCNHMGGL